MAELEKALGHEDEDAVLLVLAEAKEEGVDAEEERERDAVEEPGVALDLLVGHDERRREPAERDREPLRLRRRVRLEGPELEVEGGAVDVGDPDRDDRDREERDLEAELAE